jgi:TonB-linked SusC/RagA family outer membrane protein
MFDVVRWRGRLALAAVVALGIAPLELPAQTRGTITGVVRDATGGLPIEGAQVLVMGTSIGGVTSAAGRYTLANVPAGTHSVQARLIGYSTQSRSVAVAAGQTVTQDFSLTRSAITLDEVVVTGTGVATERRKLGNTVATIDASALENKPITSFSEVLQGREPGVVTLPSGGLTGEGARIRIRGTKSLSQSNEPIVYLNGVRIDNAGGRGNIGTGGGGLPSRLDDIDPNSIERVEVLKGAAAATLYGSEASSGVIQIFTKQGSAGPARWDVEIEQGFLRYPANAFEPNAGFVTSQSEATRLSNWWNMQIEPYRVFERDFVSGMFGTGHSQAYSLSVSGGAPILTYFVSGRYQGENGPIDGDQPVLRCDPTFAGCRMPSEFASDQATRAQGTLSLTSSPREDIQLRLNTMFTEANNSTLNNNNNIYAPITLSIFGQPQRASCVTPGGSSPEIPGTGRCQGVGNPLGQAAFATVREVLQRQIDQEARHFNGSIGARYTPTTGVALDATFGVDVVGQHDTFFQPYGYNVDLFTGNDVEGARTVSERNHRELSLDTKLSWETRPRGAWTSQLVGGVQGFVRRTQVTGGSGVGFPGPGFEIAEAGGVQDVDEFRISVVNAGLFAQEQIGWNNWVFGTVGARYDYSSAFGEAAGGALYPKASISVIPSDRPGWNSERLSTLRLRGAIGQSGLQPGAFDKLTTYSSIRSPFGPGIQPANLGNPDLKPEVATEWEVGAEVGVLGDRAALEFTFWDRAVRDALVARQYPVTGGFLNRQLANIGRIDSHGLDIGLRGTAVKRDNVQLTLFANGAYLKETLTSLGGAPAVKVGGSYPRYRNWLREGHAPGAFFGPLVRNVDYPIDTNNDCQPDTREQLLTYFGEPRSVSAFAILMEGGDPRPCSAEKGHLLHYLGKPTPDWAGSFGGNMTVFRNFEISTLFEYKAGNFHVHNLTDAFRRAHLALGGNLRAPTEARAIMANPANTAEQRLDAALLWARRYAALTPYDGLNEVESADFLRWRELSLTYSLPPAVAARVAGARSVAVTLSARNLALWTGYSGADPEINLLGRTGGGGLDDFAHGIDAFGLPLPRRFSFTARIGF